MTDDLQPHNTSLNRAAEIVGGQTQLARLLSGVLSRPVSQQWIWNVINRGRPTPAEWCLPIERATEGKVTRHDLRPDLYPRERVA